MLLELGLRGGTWGARKEMLDTDIDERPVWKFKISVFILILVLFFSFQIYQPFLPLSYGSPGDVLNLWQVIRPQWSCFEPTFLVGQLQSTKVWVTFGVSYESYFIYSFSSYCTIILLKLLSSKGFAHYTLYFVLWGRQQNLLRAGRGSWSAPQPAQWHNQLLREDYGSLKLLLPSNSNSCLGVR